MDNLIFFIFIAFTYKTSNIVYMFEIFHTEGNGGLKVSLAIIHVTTFILLSSFIFHVNPLSVVKSIFSISEIFLCHTHTHTYIFVPFLETGNKNGYSFISVMKKKMWTNVITHWLKIWFSQMQVENNDNTILNVFSVRRPNRTPREEQKRFIFANVMYY